MAPQEHWGRQQSTGICTPTAGPMMRVAGLVLMFRSCSTSRASKLSHINFAGSRRRFLMRNTGCQSSTTCWIDTSSYNGTGSGGCGAVGSGEGHGRPGSPLGGCVADGCGRAGCWRRRQQHRRCKGSSQSLLHAGVACRAARVPHGLDKTTRCGVCPLSGLCRRSPFALAFRPYCPTQASTMWQPLPVDDADCCSETRHWQLFCV